MLPFIVRRISLILITLAVVSLAIFAVTEVLPGDVAKIMMGQNATPEGLDAIRRELGLDRPAHVRYLDWVGGVVSGDWGTSYAQKLPIWTIIGPRLGNSIILAVFAFFVAVPAAVLAGAWAGIRADGLADRFLSVTGLVGISLPEFVTGVLLIVVFSSTLRLLPSSSIMLPGVSPLTQPQLMVLPTLTLTGVLFGYIMRMTRANVIEVMQAHYVRTAVLKGLSMPRIVVRHVLPNALLPTISVIAMSSGWMLGGLIIVENVFAYPGLGQLLLMSINTRDVPLLQSLALLIASTYAFSNLVADICYSILNPRVRLS